MYGQIAGAGAAAGVPAALAFTGVTSGHFAIVLTAAALLLAAGVAALRASHRSR